MKNKITVQNPIFLRILLGLTFFGLSFCISPRVFAAPAPAGASPCSANSPSRQFDYYLGNWSVSAPGSAPNATSTVTLALDGCMVVESWDGGRGHKGQNMFAYSADDKSWRGIFVDNEARAHVFVDGKVSAGSAEFEGPSRNENGETVLNRIRIVRVTPDRVEQTWEKSTDNGTTWTAAFRGIYSRKSP